MSQYESFENACNQILKRPVAIQSVRAVGGGSINLAYLLTSATDKYFLKVNQDSRALAMFEAEEDGLATLTRYSAFKIPVVYGSAFINGTSYLLMEYIDSAIRKSGYWRELAENLAKLHKTGAAKFGYKRSNFIGSLPQSNKEHSTWNDFFIHERMNPMIRLARNNNLVDQGFVKKFDLAMKNVVREMPVELPSLLHGDLWGGNLMVNESGSPTIIDPAVYFGHREMDLAFSQMFGGFSTEFYEIYNEVFPLESGFNNRVSLFNLYPYLVHLNLFGLSYFGPIEQTVQRFI